MRYLILLWRYLLQAKYANHRECVLVILDNVDTLAPRLQRTLLDLVMRSSHREGPTFVVLVRPETRRRHGLADELVDAVTHKGPPPIDVILDRLERFRQNPQSYVELTPGLSAEQAEIASDNLVDRYLSLVRLAEQRNAEIVGVTPEPVEEISWPEA